ncbi:MAG: haloacid dehalogenase-like hydrolase [Clostridia bacterium]|nr:haloacid dehalogenase-like hydrolase [Clostridia bacterium]
MLYIKEEKLKNISLTYNNFIVLMDFDRTITTSDSLGSWAVLENPKFMNPKFKEETKSLVDAYYPYELDYSISEKTKAKYMDEWYHKNMDLLYEYNLTNSILLDCVKDSHIKFHRGCKDFLKKLNELQIPVIILSAGIGNVIIELLKQNNCFYSNIHVTSNFIQFENNNMLPFSDSMIHTSNKSINRLPLHLKKEVLSKDYILLFGDLIEDLNMVKGQDVQNVISFGFLENRVSENLEHYKKAFDIVLTGDSSFVEIDKILDKLLNAN